jgi:hypothetical protein
MIANLRACFFPAPEAVRREITVEGGHLALTAGYRVKSSIRLNMLPVHIPECGSYTVEYRLNGNGEFRASLDQKGIIMVRSGLGLGQRFPVCWLPRSFAGKRVDRYILMVDRKPVAYRAGVRYRRAA